MLANYFMEWGTPAACRQEKILAMHLHQEAQPWNFLPLNGCMFLIQFI